VVNKNMLEQEPQLPKQPENVQPQITQLQPEKVQARAKIAQPDKNVVVPKYICLANERFKDE
jgi:hypothetical protein